MNVSIDHAVAQSRPRQILIVVDKLVFEDFAEYPHATRHLQQLANQGSVGMMNVRTGGSANSASGYLSLAVGSRQQADDWAANALMADEHIYGMDAALFYHGLTGNAAHSPIVHVGLGPLIANNSLGHALGTILSQQGFSVSLIGNSDSSEGRRRFGSLLAVDPDGRIMLGDVGSSVTVNDASFPGGLRTDYDAILARVRSLAGQSDLMIIDLGDLARLEATAALTLPQHQSAKRAESLSRIGDFVSTILADETFGQASITLLSPSPSIALGRDGILITPVIEWRDDRTRPGLLTSFTTRRSGIVTSGDFLPTVLDRFGIQAIGATGRVWRSQFTANPLTSMLDQYEKIKNVHLFRLPVIRPYFFGVLLLFFGGVLILARLFYVQRKGFEPSSLPHQSGSGGFAAPWKVWWRVVLTLFISYPLSLLLVSMASPMSLTGVAVLVISTVLIITVASFLVERGTGLPAIGVVASLTTIMLIADIMAGAPLMQGSLLGYDPVSGSRYYGVGNEYMGVLIGAALIAAGYVCDFLSVNDRFRSVIPAILLGIVTVIMLHPYLGINVGGAIAAAFATASAFAFGRRINVSWKNGVAWSFAILGLIAVVGLLDSYFSRSEASHLGQVVQSVGSSGTDPLWSIFGRKVATNIRLIRLTIWSRVVFVAVAVLAALLFYPNWLAKKLDETYPALTAMSKASFVAALAALVANDSGVVAAATLLLWPMLAILSVAPGIGDQAHTPST